MKEMNYVLEGKNTPELYESLSHVRDIAYKNRRFRKIGKIAIQFSEYLDFRIGFLNLKNFWANFQITRTQKIVGTYIIFVLSKYWLRIRDDLKIFESSFLEFWLEKISKSIFRTLKSDFQTSEISNKLLVFLNSKIFSVAPKIGITIQNFWNNFNYYALGKFYSVFKLVQIRSQFSRFSDFNFQEL